MIINKEEIQNRLRSRALGLLSEVEQDFMTSLILEIVIDAYADASIVAINNRIALDKLKIMIEERWRVRQHA